MGGEDLFELRDIPGGCASIENAIGKRGAEPKLVTDLFDGDLRAGGGANHQRAHTVAGDCGIQRGIAGEQAGGTAQEQKEIISDYHICIRM